MQQKLFIKLLLIILLGLLFSCRDKEPSESEFKISKKSLFEYLEKQGVSKHKLSTLKAVLIFPNGGCGGCLSSGEQFLIDSQNKNLESKIKVIYTDIKDFKKMNLRFSKSKLLEKEYVVIDRANSLNLMSFYPEIIFLKNGEIIRRLEQSPDYPDALLELDEYLK